MNVEIITLILRLVIVIVSCVIAPTVKHWLETATDNAKMESIREAAWSAVYAAEQLYNTIQNNEFSSIDELKELSGVNRSVLDRLESIGAMGDLPKSDQMSLF